MSARTQSVGAGTVASVVHETGQRCRVRVHPGADLADLRARLEQLPGVVAVRVAPTARSAVIRHDGRAATRENVLATLRSPAQRPAAPFGEPPAVHRRLPQVPPALAALGIAMIPLGPAPGVAAALGLVGLRAGVGLARGNYRPAVALDALSLATSALTGNALAATTSVFLAAVAEQWRDTRLDDTDRLLGHLTPAEEPAYRTVRDRTVAVVETGRLKAGDVLPLGPGQVVPADGVVTAGRARLLPSLHHGPKTGRSVAAGDRLPSGERIAEGAVTLLADRPPSRSRAARIRHHVRHAVSTREQPGNLTPDLDRLLSLPVTTASLVLAITRDLGRSAAMLQADPQHGLALAHPLARESAMYALARQGVLAGSLESIERLAMATTFAFEDIGVLAEPLWHVEHVHARARGVDDRRVATWLRRLAGDYRPATAANPEVPDHLVTAWVEHGALLREGESTLHVAGAEPIARTWGIPIGEAPLRSLERVLGIVDNGRLLARVTLRAVLRPTVGECFEHLRRLGVQRIAIFTESPADDPPRELLSLGAEVVVSADRTAQGRWLDEATERGEIVALVHAGMRDLLPSGGLSLCPADAEAGAHGVLLGDPLRSLVDGRAAARALRKRLRRDFAMTVTANAGLLVGSGLRLIPPIATATLHHLFALALLRRSVDLAAIDTTLPADLPAP